ncbi:MAG: hypothetical protein Q4C66_03035 [Lachnospiraceae bacterium]|nr:hypothetical protein [Lachnospiraceae bacterium]
MSFLKKQSVGFYFIIVTIIALLSSLVCYLSNCKTKYYTSFGVDTSLVAFLIIGIVVEAAYIIGVNKAVQGVVIDVFAVAGGVFCMLAMVAFLRVRAYSIATILTFQNNDSNLSDMKGAIVAMVLCAAAVVLSILSSYMRVVKED